MVIEKYLLAGFPPDLGGIQLISALLSKTQMLYLTKMGYMEYKPPGSMDSELSSAVGNVESDPCNGSCVNLMLVKSCLGLYTEEVWIMTSIHYHTHLPSPGKEMKTVEQPVPVVCGVAKKVGEGSE
jgi:hypothetical protein